MTTFELVLRTMAATELVCLAILLIVRSRDDRALRYAALLPVGLASFMATSAPQPPGSLGMAEVPLTLVCVANPAWFWIFTQAWFDDDFSPGARDALVLAAMVGLGAVHELGYASGDTPPLVDALFKAAVLGCFVASIAKVVGDRRSDLVEARRRWRSWFVVGVGAYVAIAIAFQVGFSGHLPAALVRANVALLIACALALSVALVAVPARAPRAAVPVRRAARLPGAIDQRLLEAIRDAMETRRLYRDENLTVAGLAEAVHSQEYRVRRAINRGLGHRNFNEFLHGYRLGEAEARLRAQPQLPVLTIALDVGFGSIGPFNRAFRKRHGCTPTEYRAGSETGHVSHEIGAPSPGR